MFHVFLGGSYYPDGGMGDYHGGFETIDAAKEAAEKERWDWVHIATLKDGQLITVAWGKRKTKTSQTTWTSC